MTISYRDVCNKAYFRTAAVTMLFYCLFLVVLVIVFDLEIYTAKSPTVFSQQQQQASSSDVPLPPSWQVMNNNSSRRNAPHHHHHQSATKRYARSIDRDAAEDAKFDQLKLFIEIEPDNDDASRSSSSSHHQVFNEALLASPEFKSAQRKYKNFCADPRNCYSHKCYAPLNYTDGGCFPSPYNSDIVYAVRRRMNLSPKNENEADQKSSRANSNSSSSSTLQQHHHYISSNKNDEFTCPDRVDDRHDYWVRNYGENQVLDPLFDFKKNTNWMFGKWYDWRGKCVASTTTTTISDVEEERQKSTTTTATADNSHPQQQCPCTCNNKTQQNDAVDEIVAAAKKNEEFIASGKHSEEDGLYHLKNICFRPLGGMMGYAPKLSSSSPILEPFHGIDEVFHANLQQDAGHFKEFFENKRFEVMQKPADCYLDTTVILMPIHNHIVNTGHAFSRYGSLTRVKELVLKNKNKNKKNQKEKKKKTMQQNDDTDITIAYAVLDGDLFPAHVTKNNGFRYFYDAINTSWFSFFGHEPFWHHRFSPGHRSQVARDEIYGFSPNETELSSSKACFKEVVVWQDGYVGEFNDVPSLGVNPQDRGQTGKKNVPGRDTTFSLYGKSSDHARETLQIMQDRLRECGRLPPRRNSIRRRRSKRNRKYSNNNNALRVVLLSRSRTRRITHQPYIVDYLAHRLPQLFSSSSSHDVVAGVTIEVMETNVMSFRDVIKQLTDVDVLIGVYGGSLMWSAFMPKTAIVVELSIVRSDFGTLNYPHRSGLSLEGNGEFEHVTRVQDQFHLKIFDPIVDQRYPVSYTNGWGAYTDLAHSASGDFFDETVMKPVLCVVHSIENISNNNNNDITNTNISSSSSSISDFIASSVAACSHLLNDSIVTKAARRQYDDPIIRKWNIARIASTRSFPRTKEFHHDHTNRRRINHHHSHRLELIRRFKRTAGNALSRFLNRVEDPTFEKVPWTENNLIDTRILIVEPCAARASVWAEVAALRQIVRGCEQIHIAEYALGHKKCDAFETLRAMEEEEEKQNQQELLMKNNQHEKSRRRRISSNNNNKALVNLLKMHEDKRKLIDFLVPRRSGPAEAAQLVKWWDEKALRRESNEVSFFDYNNPATFPRFPNSNVAVPFELILRDSLLDDDDADDERKRAQEEEKSSSSKSESINMIISEEEMVVNKFNCGGTNSGDYTTCNSARPHTTVLTFQSSCCKKAPTKKDHHSRSISHLRLVVTEVVEKKS